MTPYRLCLATIAALLLVLPLLTGCANQRCASGATVPVTPTETAKTVVAAPEMAVTGSRPISASATAPMPSVRK